MPNPNGPEDHETSRSRRALRAVRSHVQPGSFPLLLFAAVLLYVLNGLAVDSMAGAILVQVARIGVTCASIYVLSAYRPTPGLGAPVAGPVLTLEARVWGPEPQITPVLPDSMTTGSSLCALAAG